MKTNKGRSTIFILNKGIRSLTEKISPEKFMLLLIFTYSVLFSTLTIIKFESLGMNAWDFGINLQAIHTTAVDGRFFYSTAELSYTLTAFPAGTQFAVHFSPIFFFVVPIYWIFQSPLTLLVIKTLAISLGALPVFILAKKVLGNSNLGLLFGIGYLLYPAVHSINWYDFQPQIFFVPLILYTILFIEIKKTKLMILFSILTLSTIELAPFFMIMLGISYLIRSRKKIISKIRIQDFSKILKTPSVILILLSILWLVIILSTIYLFGWQTSFHLSNSRRVSTLNIVNLVESLSFNWENKILFIILLFGPFIFLSFLSPVRMFPAIIWIIYAIFSTYSPYYSISFHYLSFVIPFILISSIFGLKKIQKNHNISRTFKIILFINITIFTLISSPISTLHLGNHYWAGPYGIPSITNHEKQAHDLLNLIPDDASVLTSNSFFPTVAQRVNSYVFPFSATFPQNISNSSNTQNNFSDFNGTLNTLINRVEYVLYDGVNDKVASVLLSNHTAMKQFGLYAESDGIVLFKREYSNEPVVFLPFQRTFYANDLILKNSSKIVYDPASEAGYVICHYSSESVTDMWHGPPIFLQSGSYSVSFRLKYGENTSSNLISIAVVEWPTKIEVKMQGSPEQWYIPNIHISSDSQRILVASSIDINNFISSEKYETIILNFKINSPGSFEFDGLSVPKGTEIYLDNIKLRQISP